MNRYTQIPNTKIYIDSFGSILTPNECRDFDDLLTSYKQQFKTKLDINQNISRANLAKLRGVKVQTICAGESKGTHPKATLILDPISSKHVLGYPVLAVIKQKTLSELKKCETRRALNEQNKEVIDHLKQVAGFSEAS